MLYAFGNDNVGTLGKSKATVQIELGGVATPYKPFEKETLNLITPTGLPGIPVDSDGNYTDENGQQWVCDEVDFERGVYVQRVKKIDLKALKFHKSARFNGNGVYFNATINDAAEGNERRNTISNIGTCDNPYASAGDFVWVFNNTKENVVRIGFKDATIDSTQKLTVLFEELEEVYAMFPLAVPIETPLTQEQITAYKSFTTHKTTTLFSNDAGAGMEVTYVADPKAYIDNKFAELSQAIVASASEAE